MHIIDDTAANVLREALCGIYADLSHKILEESPEAAYIEIQGPNGAWILYLGRREGIVTLS